MFDRPLKTEAVGVVSGIVIDKVTDTFSFTWKLGIDSPLLRYRAIVPAGFVTDYASIPNLAQRLAGLKPDDPDYAQAAVLHDILCQRRTIDIIGPTGELLNVVPISRKEVDQIFKRAMLSLNCPPWKVNTLYTAVRFYATVTFIR